MYFRHFPLLLLLGWLALASTLTFAAADGPLTMGVFPRRSAVVTREMFQPLADYLSKQIGRKVKLVVPIDFDSFWQKVQDGEFQLIHYNQYHYIKAHKLFGHRAILMNQEYGRTVIRSAILVNADSNLNKVGELRGHKIVFGGGRGAMVSYIMAIDMLRRAGLRDNDYVSSFALNPIAAVVSLHYRQADASSGSDILQKMRGTPWQSNPPRALALSDPIAQLPWAVSASVNQALADQITNALSYLDSTPQGRAILKKAQLTGLRPANDQDYDSSRQIVARTLGEQY